MRPIHLAILLLFTAVSCKENISRPGEKTAEAPTVITPPSFKTYQLVDLDASKDMRSILCQHWMDKEDASGWDDAEQNSDLELPLRGYHFFTDGLVVKDPRTGWQEGKWTMNAEKKRVTIDIAYANGKTEQFRLAMLTPFTLKLSPGGGQPGELKEYGGEGIAHEVLSEDPFYPSNNDWRKKPAHAETEQALMRRLQQAVHFYILFYDHVIHTKATEVNFSGLPTCFRWYAGGIYQVKDADLQQGWIDCFYNKAQALQANAIVLKLLREKYQWPKTDEHTNWLNQNVAVLRQMEQVLERWREEKVG